MKKIALIGMMGSGKTTVGKKLANTMDLEFYCTDELIEDKENMNISKIFELYGEKYFREVEKEVLKSVSKSKEAVISTGGGIILNEDNINNLKGNGFYIVLIERNINDIINTLSNSEKNERPLIKDDLEKLKIIYNERKYLYKKYADIIIENKDSIEETVEKIKNAIEGNYKNNKKIIKIKGKKIGGSSSLICLPITSKNFEELEKDLNKLKELNPDILEWRVDYFNVQDLKKEEILKNIIKLLKEETKKIPFILTCRDIEEGGVNKLDDELKIEIIKKFLYFNIADIIDIELDRKEDFKNEIKREVINNNKYIIYSYHNFEEMPEKGILKKKITQANKEHADIIKIACKANLYGDVLRLFNVTFECKEIIKKPMITLAMGEYGKISRVFGGCFGSDITFAKGIEKSASGQIEINIIRNIWKEIDLKGSKK